ncbi:MAG TPA: metallophosphoesterase [Methanobacteriaceae archaeon]|nr:metallophosphoesterase [Methanobacteriaceae archaeon]
MAYLAHISDLHVGSVDFREELIIQAVDDINSSQPDATIVTGDITENGYYQEFERAAGYLDLLKSPMLVVPGNHDARHVGDETFRELIKERYGTLKVKKKGLKIIGLDSSEPDLDYGKVGRSQENWMIDELQKATEIGLYRIIALHHHIIPVPRTGRERNVLSDAGDILLSMVDNQANLVLSGHKHIPHVWMVENTAFSTAGTVSSLKLRGKEHASYNIVDINDDYIEILLNSADGEVRSLAKYENTCR